MNFSSWKKLDSLDEEYINIYSVYSTPEHDFKDIYYHKGLHCFKSTCLICKQTLSVHYKYSWTKYSSSLVKLCDRRVIVGNILNHDELLMNKALK